MEQFRKAAAKGLSQEELNQITGYKHLASQKEWLDKRGRLKAFDTLAQRHQSRVVYAEARSEQKAFDEHATRRYLDKDVD